MPTTLPEETPPDVERADKQSGGPQPLPRPGSPDPLQEMDEDDEEDKELIPTREA